MAVLSLLVLTCPINKLRYSRSTDSVWSCECQLTINNIECVDLFGREWAIDLLAISETWLISSIESSFIAIGGFVL